MPHLFVVAQDFSEQYHSATSQSPNDNPELTRRLEMPSQFPQPQKKECQVILLKNDHVITGQVIDEDATLQVRSEIGVIQIQKSDIATTAGTLSEIYHFKKNRIQDSSAEFLKLANWCVANRLQEEADYEFDRAILWAENRSLADALRTQKNVAMSTFEGYKLQKELLEQEKLKYDQWKKQVPPATFQAFKREILPMLSRNCSGIACHSSNSLNDFRLIPNPYNNDLDVAKNMQTVLGYIVPQAAEKSPLVLVPIAPHGRTKQIFTRRNIGHYEKLYEWVDRVADEMSDYYPLDEDDRVARSDEASRVQETILSEELDLALAMQRDADNRVTFPASEETLVMHPTTAARGPSSMSYGLTNMQNQNKLETRPLPFVSNNSDKIVFPAGSGSMPPRGVQEATATTTQMTAQSSAQAPVQQSRFNFFEQQQKQVEIMTHGSTDAFERGNVIQSLQRDPLDPFDPVWFNRRYHLKRIVNEPQQ